MDKFCRGLLSLVGLAARTGVVVSLIDKKQRNIILFYGPFLKPVTKSYKVIL